MGYRILLAFGTLSLLLATPVTHAADTYTVLRVSTPLIASGAAAVRLGEFTPQLRPALQAKVGVGGGRVAIGYDHVGLKRLGYGFQAVLPHTWFKPLEIDRDQTFLGLDAELSAGHLLLNVGGYRRVNAGDDDRLVSAGLGFIF